MLLIITTLGTAAAGEFSPACPSTMSCADPYRFELEGLDTPGRSLPLNLNTEWQQPTAARLTANTVVTASGLALTLLSIHMFQDAAVLPGDLVPGQAILAGVGGGALLIGGGAMWITTDFSADRSGLQKGFAIRGVW